jgi:hypothetical protein
MDQRGSGGNGPALHGSTHVEVREDRARRCGTSCILVIYKQALPLDRESYVTFFELPAFLRLSWVRRMAACDVDYRRLQ